MKKTHFKTFALCCCVFDSKRRRARDFRQWQKQHHEMWNKKNSLQRQRVAERANTHICLKVSAASKKKLKIKETRANRANQDQIFDLLDCQLCCYSLLGFFEFEFEFLIFPLNFSRFFLFLLRLTTCRRALVRLSSLFFFLTIQPRVRLFI